MAVTITIHLRTYNFTFSQDSSQESSSESTNGMLLATDIATYVQYLLCKRSVHSKCLSQIVVIKYGCKKIYVCTYIHMYVARWLMFKLII